MHGYTLIDIEDGTILISLRESRFIDKTNMKNKFEIDVLRGAMHNAIMSTFVTCENVHAHTSPCMQARVVGAIVLFPAPSREVHIEYFLGFTDSAISDFSIRKVPYYNIA